MAMSTLRTFALITGCNMALATPLWAADAHLSCVWLSHGPNHEKRTFEITFDQQMQRAQLGSNDSLPASISDSRISFAVNLSGSIFQYVIDRTSGFGTLTIRDAVMYSGQCGIVDPPHRTS
jgi:hypothetical protein